MPNYTVKDLHPNPSKFYIKVVDRWVLMGVSLTALRKKPTKHRKNISINDFYQNFNEPG